MRLPRGGVTSGVAKLDLPPPLGRQTSQPLPPSLGASVR
jgi:hypothetical protein